MNDSDTDSLSWYMANVSEHYKFNLKLAYLNINSITNKIYEVKEMLGKEMFDILFIAESKLTLRPLQHYSPNLALGLYVETERKAAEDFVYRRAKFEPRDEESICLDVKDVNNSRFLVYGCYRSPGKCNEFVASMSSAAELMYKTRKGLLLIRDFNQDIYTNFVVNGLPNKNLLDLCHRFCFVNKITEPIRVTDITKSLLGVILVERHITSGNLQLGLSDHDLVFVVRKNKFPRPKPGLIEYRSIKNFDNEEFLTELENAPWGSAYCFSDVDDIWGHCSALYKNIFDRHGPVKNKWVRGDHRGYHLKFSTKSPGTIGCLNVTGRTQLTISGLRLSNSVTKSPR